MKIDLHMHSSVSDGTDTPAELLNRIRSSEIEVFSLTDHDDCLGCEMIDSFLEPDDPVFIPGVELSAELDEKKFHILGYAYRYTSPHITGLIKEVHAIRMQKITEMIDFVHRRYGFEFPQEELASLINLPNPGKPHLSRLMVQHNYAKSISDGINHYLNTFHSDLRDISPEKAIETILASGGIPVLAHGIFGDGRQYLNREELDSRIAYLTSLGLMGVECYYSGYSEADALMTQELCRNYGLYSTAGSDYHGNNKTVLLGFNHLHDAGTDPNVMAFLHLCAERAAK